MGNILALAVGSFAGGFARYYLAGWIYRVWGTQFPYGTLIVNLLGCFAIGFFSALAGEKYLLSPQARLLLMTGFCGAFTTFSTFMLETANLMKGGEIFFAFLNVAASLVIGFMVFRLGVILGDLI
jgi:CrcB protein